MSNQPNNNSCRKPYSKQCKNTLAKNKSGQMMVFILLAILAAIVIIVGYFLYASSQKSGLVQRPKLSLEMMPITNYITECLHDVSTDAVYLAGAQGGYAIQPPKFIDSLGNDVGFGYYRGLDLLPSKSYIEMELAMYIEGRMARCINLTEFEQQGKIIQQGNASVKVIILGGKVLITLYHPTTLSYGSAVLQESEYRTEVNVRLGELHDIAKYIIKQHLNDPDWIPIDYFHQLGKNGYKTRIIPYNQTIFTYSLTDTNSLEKGRPGFTLSFAYEKKHNFQPEILTKSPVMLFDGEHYKLRLVAYDPDDENLTYTLIGGMFSINETGWYEFTPEIPGEFNYPITVKDPHGNSVTKTITYKVIVKNKQPQLFAHDIIAVKGVPVKDKFFAYDIDDNILEFKAEPDWFRIDSKTGEISFVPERAGKFSIKISVTDGAATSTETITLEVRAPETPELEINVPAVLTTQSKRPFEYHLDIIGGRKDSLTELPILNCSSDFFEHAEIEGCVIKYTPQVSFSREITITATDGIQTATKKVVLKVV